uniref:adrenocortical dysplasia protein homolog n=1 Tax=Scatophagus argus TaxID=75038 RepID=UPI001ED83796|nr:adrenocortical dysplasia protein homolog [Scatophagus argus]
MPRPARSRLSPWIENLILSYGSDEGSGSSGRLKAHVIGVGQMSQSQAQGSDSPTGLLFLSDGVIQIPAILTASAWEHLQDQEDRESFTSLVNTTVCIQNYQLQFHMVHEQTKCRFFLSVGELATTAAGPVKDSTPCCTSLPSVRLKICKTWKALQHQEVLDSQMSQCGFDLSELLGEWQHDCMQAVLEDVKERLMFVSSRPVSTQPSTSTSTSLPTHPDTSTATSWDVDRVRYKRIECFSVPIKCLQIPEEDAEQIQTAPTDGRRTQNEFSAASEDRKRDLSQVCKPPETAQPSVDEVEWQLTKQVLVETDQDASETSPPPVENSMLEHMIAIDSDIRPLSNPWDIFPPPCVSSSPSDVSSEATPTHSLHSPSAGQFKPDHAAMLSSTQFPVFSSKESKTSEHSTGEQSYLPPYQKPPLSTSFATTVCSSASTSVSPPEPFTRPLLPATDEVHTDTVQQTSQALDQERVTLDKATEETVGRKDRKAKRKRSEPSPEALSTLVDEEEEEEEALISVSPPSWLFDTQAGCGTKDDHSQQRGQTGGTVLRQTPTVHSDGRPFSYSYQVCGQNLQDFSQFRVVESWLHWAVKYLVAPKQTDNPHSDQTSSDQTEVTPL